MKSKEEIESLSQSSGDALKTSIESLDLSDLGQFLATISTFEEKERNTKFHTALSALSSHESFEVVGRFMTVPLFSSLMKTTGQKAFIKPVLVGMPSAIFTSYLENAGLKSLEALKQESASEPLYTHLLAAQAYAIKDLEELFNQFESLKFEIMNAKIEEMTAEELAYILQSLDTLHERNAKACRLLDNMLLLAWNSGKSELIETLSTLKENASRLLNVDIGTKNGGKTPTGLFYILKSKLDSVFQKKDNFGNSVPLPDDYPALEALSCFSLWYPQDYKKVGLIIGDKEEKLAEADLYNLAKERLEKAGLLSLLDIKEKGIYSAKMLKEYLTAKSS